MKENLEENGYLYLMSIDEDYYPDNLLNGNYPFNYGALYIYYKDNKEKILTWEHKSRKDSWTEEMKVIAKETGRKGGLTRWKRK